MRWSHILNDYNFEIIYRPGSNNKVADALSRQSQDNKSTLEEAPILPDIIGLNVAEEDNEEDWMQFVNDEMIENETSPEVIEINDSDSEEEEKTKPVSIIKKKNRTPIWIPKYVTVAGKRTKEQETQLKKEE